MKSALSPLALRIIGCLLEKQVTTPEQYPLSLNAVVTACNQKSNREPVMNLSESEVMEVLDQLVKKHLVTASSGSGQRVAKYEQRFCNSAFGNLKLNSAEVAILTLLFLRGAQTPGELRTRSGRLHEFSEVAEVESTLAGLVEREMVTRLPREPGKRESRYLHLFGDEQTTAEAETPREEESDLSLSARVAALEQSVSALQALVQTLLHKGG
ncbi:YceH family protein [Pantoea sp. KPR_PJ]|uniref:YceH family protein n=1 Tax=Pantoea sp. KPR_PJ TaxID=2738375 RepID=UPI003527A0F0